MPGIVQEHPATSEEVASQLTQLLISIVELLVQKPTEIVVVPLRHGDEIELCLRVSQTDMGRVIGESGKTARALRTLMIAAAMKMRSNVKVTISEGSRGPSC